MRWVWVMCVLGMCVVVVVCFVCVVLGVVVFSNLMVL